jgi:hypothetical protein
MTDQELELLCAEDAQYTELWRRSLTDEQLKTI